MVLNKHHTAGTRNLEVYKNYGLKQLFSEKCIFKRKDNSAILAIYIDDGILFGKNTEDLKDLLSKLKNNFEMTFNKNPSSFLGLEIHRRQDGIKLNQYNYSRKILETYNMDNAKAVDMPILANSELNNVANKIKSFPFREAVGSLLYLAAKTRPDLSYAVAYHSRDTQNPSDISITNVKRSLRYL